MPHPTIVSATLTEHAHSHGRAATRHRTPSPPPPLVSHSPPRPDSVTSFRRAESPSALSSHSRAELATEARFHQKKCVVDANCVSSRESKSCGSTMLLNGLTGSISSGRCIISGDHTSYAQANAATTDDPPQHRGHKSHLQRSPPSYPPRDLPTRPCARSRAGGTRLEHKRGPSQVL